MNDTYLNYVLFGLKVIATQYGLKDPVFQIEKNILEYQEPQWSEIMGLLVGTELFAASKPIDSVESIFSFLSKTEQKDILTYQPIRLQSSYFSYQTLTDQDRKVNQELLEQSLRKVAELDDPEEFLAASLEVNRLFGGCIAVNSSLPHVSFIELVTLGGAVDVCRKSNEESLLLLKGDFSGIQDYIYKIVSKTASKSLKGRSFYLQLLMDAITRYLCDQLKINEFHIVYSSGGQFMMIAPNVEGTKDEVLRCGQYINQQMFASYGLNLFMALGCQQLNYSELTGAPLADKKDQLDEILASQKRRKHIGTILNAPALFFEKMGKAWDNPRDAVTGEEIDGKVYLLDAEVAADQPGNSVGAIVKEQVDLGKKLRDMNFIGISTKTISSADIQPGKFGKHYQVYSHQERPENFEDLIEVFQFASADGNLNPIMPKIKTRFYGGNIVPTSIVDGKLQVKTFDQFAGLGEFKRLGILRMDVDNLGKVFHEKVENLLEHSILSRHLDYFFKGYINTIWHDSPGCNESSMIVYSGGDDLFVLGRWDLMLEFAQRVQEAFTIWAGYSEFFTISAGLVIVPPKYPVMRAALSAKDAEDMAKSHHAGKKNSITIFGKPLSWQLEFPVARQLKTQIARFVALTGNHALFHKIVDLHQLKVSFPLKWSWKAAYQFRRWQDQTTSIPAKALLQEWSTNCFTNQFICQDSELHWKYHENHDVYDFLDFLAIAARWAELEYRTNQISEYA